LVPRSTRAVLCSIRVVCVRREDAHVVRSLVPRARDVSLLRSAMFLDEREVIDVAHRRASLARGLFAAGCGAISRGRKPAPDESDLCSVSPAVCQRASSKLSLLYAMSLARSALGSNGSRFSSSGWCLSSNRSPLSPSRSRLLPRLSYLSPTLSQLRSNFSHLRPNVSQLRPSLHARRSGRWKP